jgi:hypothetical protein
MCFVFKLSTAILVQTLIFRKINPPHLMELASGLRISKLETVLGLGVLNWPRPTPTDGTKVVCSACRLDSLD